MKRYIIKRIAWLVPIMLVISFITFSLMYLSPGDPVLIYLSQGGDAPNMEAAAELREKLGLNAPFLVQYGRWIINALHGELGTSTFTGNPVAQEIATYFPNTLKLTFLAVFLTLLISIPLGIIAAVFENRIIDYIIRFFAFINGVYARIFCSHADDLCSWSAIAAASYRKLRKCERHLDACADTYFVPFGRLCQTGKDCDHSGIGRGLCAAETRTRNPGKNHSVFAEH